MSTLAACTRRAARLIDDWSAYSQLPDEVKDTVMERLRWVDLHRQAAHRSKTSIVKQAARDLGVKQAAVYRYLKRFEEKGWQGLIDGRAAGVGSKGLPPAFKSFVAGIFDSHQRGDDGKEAHRKIIDRWMTWRETGHPDFAIPGYEFPPPADPKTGEPHGWSYDNLLNLRPKKAARALTKQGPKEASKYLPAVLTTRVGSAFLSRVLFDDQDLDNLLADGHLAIAGITSAQKPVSFNSLDFYTAAHLGQHLRAQYKDAASGKDKTLTGQEFAWFTIAHLQQWGWRTDDLGTELIQEHGTAKTWANKDLTSLGGHHSFEDALFALTGGKCRINRSGKFDSPIFADMCFRPSATGNFKFKTWIESAFRLLRTYMQALPGATGSRERDNGREETYGIRIVEKQLLSAIFETVDRGTQEFIRDHIRHELLDLPTFHALICAVYRAVNARTKHNLEGWHQCGNTVQLWRPSERSETWFSQDELAAIEDPEEKRFLLRRLNANRDTLMRVEKLSPASVLEIERARDAAVIRKLPDEMVGLLLPREWAVEITVDSSHSFQLPNLLWPETPETYVASWEHRGAQITLDAGWKGLAFHNAFGDGRAQIHALDGRYITTLHPEVKAEPFRHDKTLAQLATRAKVKSGHQAHVKARLADIAADRVSAREHNKVLLDLTREDRQRAAKASQDARTTAAESTRRTAADDADAAIAAAARTVDQTHTDDIDF